ncbi:MAG: methyltransferase domain-containing protein [Rhodoplanes sp.]
MTEQAEEIHALVREKYGALARKDASGCGCSCGSADEADSLDMIGDAYKSVDGYVAEADLGLGCGLPTEHANIKPGETVLDLGAGAGIDAFVARRLVGESGQVYGVDMTPDMAGKARFNAEKLGYRNVEFRLGEIERLPFERDSIDLVISNCVLNLVPDKARAFAEIFRVLRPGARFCVSDIVASAPLPGGYPQGRRPLCRLRGGGRAGGGLPCHNPRCGFRRYPHCEIPAHRPSGRCAGRHPWDG